MNRNIVITIIVILMLLVIGLGGYYYLVVSKQPATPGQQTSIIRQFFPFGQNENTSTTTETASETSQTPSFAPPKTSDYTKKLRKISSEPVAGFGITSTASSTVIRYIEVATGHVYDTELGTPNQTRITNTTIPLTYNALWGNKNNIFVAQYLKDDNQTIDTDIMTITATSSGLAIQGALLSSQVLDISVLGNTLFYLKNNNSGSVGTVTTLDAKKQKQIWSSPIHEFNSQVVSDTTIALTSKPYQNIQGVLYLINTSTGKATDVLGSIPGLSTLVSGDAARVLYLSQDDQVSMFLYSIKDSSTTRITPTTFPEKCVWSKKDTNIVYCAVPKQYLDGTSLTNWYMGTVSFTDQIWRYDLKQNTAVLTEDFSVDGGGQIDVEKLQVSDGDHYLVFINKIDNTLWSVDLTK